MIFKPKLKVFWCSGFLYCLIWRDGQGPLKIEVFEILNHLFSFYLKNQRGRKWECRWVITFLGNREFLTMGIWNLKLHNVVVVHQHFFLLVVMKLQDHLHTKEKATKLWSIWSGNEKLLKYDLKWFINDKVTSQFSVCMLRSNRKTRIQGYMCQFL